MLLPFLFVSPLSYFSGIAGPEEAKNLAGQQSSAGFGLIQRRPVLKKLEPLVKAIPGGRESPIRVPQTPSTFHPHAQ
jgi:hypothetical protein